MRRRSTCKSVLRSSVNHLSKMSKVNFWLTFEQNLTVYEFTSFNIVVHLVSGEQIDFKGFYHVLASGLSLSCGILPFEQTVILL